jgi:hypothetical protein
VAARDKSSLLIPLAREACLEVEAIRLQRLEPAAPLSLDELVELHGAAAEGAVAKLEQVRACA